MKTKRRSSKATLLVCLAIVQIAAVRGQQPAASPIPATPAVIQPKVIDDPAVRSGWKRYQFGDEPAFSVILPSAPAPTAERTSGGSILYLYICATDTAVYGAARMSGLGADLEHGTEPYRQTFFRNYIEGFAAGFQESIKKTNSNYDLKLLDTRKITAAGREAFQQDLTMGPFQGSAQLVFVGSEAFSVLSIWNPQTPAADREAFWSSFKVTITPK